MENKKIHFEGIATFESEDGGAAQLASFPSSLDESVCLNLISWDENAWDDEAISHSTVKALKGKKVRITIEILD